MLVRRLKVSKALHWLKLNHADYYDCENFREKTWHHIQRRSTSGCRLLSNKNPESTSVNDMDEEEGTSEGPCSFVVHGLTGEEFLQKL